MDYMGFIAFVLSIPLGYFLEVLVVQVYINWTVCKRNILGIPLNILYTLALALAFLQVYMFKPGLQDLTGVLVGFSFALGEDYGSTLSRMDEARDVCLQVLSRQSVRCRECYDECINKCIEVEHG